MQECHPSRGGFAFRARLPAGRSRPRHSLAADIRRCASFAAMNSIALVAHATDVIRRCASFAAMNSIDLVAHATDVIRRYASFAAMNSIDLVAHATDVIVRAFRASGARSGRSNPSRVKT